MKVPAILFYRSPAFFLLKSPPELLQPCLLHKMLHTYLIFRRFSGIFFCYWDARLCFFYAYPGALAGIFLFRPDAPSFSTTVF